MSFNIGDIVNSAAGEFTLGNATVIQIVDPAQHQPMAYAAQTNPAYMIEFSGGSITIVDGINLRLINV